MFGCGSVAQVVLSRGTHGGFLTINLAFGFAVTLGVLVAGQVSGKASASPSVHVPTRCPIEEGGFQEQARAVASALSGLLGEEGEEETDT